MSLFTSSTPLSSDFFTKSVANEESELLIIATLNDTSLLPLFSPPKTNRKINGKTMVKNRAKRSRKNRFVLMRTKVRTVKRDLFFITLPPSDLYP